MNLFDVRVGCDEQRSEHRSAATIAEVDVVVVWPEARTFVVDRTTELDRHRRTGRPWIGIRLEMQYSLVDVWGAFWVHASEGSAARPAPRAPALVLASRDRTRLGLGELHAYAADLARPSGQRE